MSETTLRRSHADDSLNVKYGRVAIRDSAFVDSFADAIDLDWTQATIERSLFARTGPNGDGVDVSGSTAAIDDTVFSEVKDKCVSVGEHSQAIIRGSLLRRCTLGVASKDLSETEIRESLFLHNERDLTRVPEEGGLRGRSHPRRGRDPGRRGQPDPRWTRIPRSKSFARWRSPPSEATARDAAGGTGLDLDGLSRVTSFSAARYQELRQEASLRIEAKYHVDSAIAFLIQQELRASGYTSDEHGDDVHGYASARSISTTCASAATSTRSTG